MILAALIFSMVAVGILGVWEQQYRAVSKSGAVLIARYLGERLMEECVAAKYDGVDSLAGPTPDMFLNETVKGDQVTTVYSGNIDVQNIQVQPGVPDTKLVVVTVSWKGDAGISSITYRTYLQENG